MKNTNGYNSSVIEIQTRKGAKLININNIVYIKAVNKGSQIHLKGEEVVKSNYLLKKYNMYLKEEQFFRCHNSYLVNFGFVDFYSSREIILIGNERIPLSRNRKRLFKKTLEKFVAHFN